MDSHEEAVEPQDIDEQDASEHVEHTADGQPNEEQTDVHEDSKPNGASHAQLDTEEMEVNTEEDAAENAQDSAAENEQENAADSIEGNAAVNATVETHVGDMNVESQQHGTSSVQNAASAEAIDKDADGNGAVDDAMTPTNASESVEQPNGENQGKDEDKEEDDPMKLPPFGTEIFLGNIPHSSTREDIEKFCSKVAPLYSLHIPAPKTEGSANPGYAFAMFQSRVAAAEAIEQLGGSSMPSGPNRQLTVKYASKQRNKLYVCNIPKQKKRQELLAAFRELVPGVMDLDVTMQKDQGKPSENRGFCFLEMYNQGAAEQAMTVLTSPSVQFDGKPVSPELRVEWADTKAHEADQSDVKSLHVSKLPEDCTEEQIRSALEEFAPIERIALLDQKQTRPGEAIKKREYAFVHYSKRSSALKVWEACQKNPVSINGTELYVSMAKPVGVGREDRAQERRDSGGIRAMDRSRQPPRYNARSAGAGPGGPGFSDDWDGYRSMGHRGPRDRPHGGFDHGYDRRPMRERERGMGGPPGMGGRGPSDRRGPGGPGPRMGEQWGPGGDGYGYQDMHPPGMARGDPWGGPPNMEPPMMPMPYMMPGMMPGMMPPEAMGQGRGVARGEYDSLSRPKPSTSGYGAARGGGQDGAFGAAATRGYGAAGTGGRAPPGPRGYNQRYHPY